VPAGVVQHRITAKMCWDAAGKLTFTSAGSDVSTLWAGTAIGYTSRAFTPFQLGASIGTLHDTWVADGRAQGCLGWKLPLCGFVENWRFDVKFFAPAFAGPKPALSQAATFTFRPLNSSTFLKVKGVTTSTF